MTPFAPRSSADLLNLFLVGRGSSKSFHHKAGGVVQSNAARRGSGCARLASEKLRDSRHLAGARGAEGATAAGKDAPERQWRR